MRGFGGLGHGSFLVHCPYIAARGDILYTVHCGVSLEAAAAWSHEAQAQCASLQPARTARSLLPDAAAPGQPASFAATHGGSTTDTRRDLSGHRGRGDPKLGRPDGRLHRMHHRSVMHTL
jgi:hypothetical protein